MMPRPTEALPGQQDVCAASVCISCLHFKVQQHHQGWDGYIMGTISGTIFKKS